MGISFQKIACRLLVAYGGKAVSVYVQARNMAYVRNPGRDISFPIFIRKEIETRKLERKSKQKISGLIDLLYRLSDIISR